MNVKLIGAMIPNDKILDYVLTLNFELEESRINDSGKRGISEAYEVQLNEIKRGKRIRISGCEWKERKAKIMNRNREREQ